MLYLRIAGAVADEQPVEFFFQKVKIPGNQVYPGSPVEEAPQLVKLEAAVDGTDSGTALRIVRDGTLKIKIRGRRQVHIGRPKGTRVVKLETLMETSSTRFTVDASVILTSSSPRTIFPLMVPFSRITFVSCRVSMPRSPGIP